MVLIFRALAENAHWVHGHGTVFGRLVPRVGSCPTNNMLITTKMKLL
jgi:hypothetical protein